MESIRKEDMSRESIKAIVFEKLSMAIMVLGIPVSIFVTVRIVDESLPKTFVPVVILLVLMMASHIFKKYLTLGVRYNFFIFALLFFGIAQLLNQGLYSQAQLVIPLLAVFLMLGAPQPILLGFLATVFMVLIGIGQAHIMGFYPEPSTLSVPASSYARMISTIGLIGVLVFTIAIFLKALEAREIELNKTHKTMEKHLQQLEQAYAELTLLKSIINVCSNCGKAHIGSTETGSERWDSLEAYLRENTQAQLSHGYCPDCFTSELDILNHD